MTEPTLSGDKEAMFRAQVGADFKEINELLMGGEDAYVHNHPSDFSFSSSPTLQAVFKEHGLIGLVYHLEERVAQIERGRGTLAQPQDFESFQELEERVADLEELWQNIVQGQHRWNVKTIKRVARLEVDGNARFFAYEQLLERVDRLEVEFAAIEYQAQDPEPATPLNDYGRED